MTGAATDIVKQIPGLWAQNPDAVGENDFLGRLRKGQFPEGVTYSAVTTHYVPGGGVNVVRLLAEAEHLAADKFFGDWNDLVVNTSHVWAVDREANKDQFSKRLPADRLLIYNPGGQMKVPANGSVPTTVIDLAGVHHTNLFSFDQTRRFLQTQLSRK